MQLTDLLASVTAAHSLLAQLHGRDVRITGMSLDSREIARGGLFLALSGGERHGLEFLDQALANGAVAVLWEVADDADWSAFVAARRGEVIAIPVLGLSSMLGALADRFFAMPSANMDVVGITGTDGKTSVAHLVARALDRQGARCGLIGTLGNGFPDQLEAGTHTTPDVVTTHQLLARLHDQGTKAVVMEASSHGLDQGRVDAVRFSIAVLTNLSRDHLDYHGSVAAYAEAKRRLFLAPGLKVAVLNGDDEFGRDLLRDPGLRAKKIVYGRAGMERSMLDRAGETLILNSVMSHQTGLELELAGSLVGAAGTVYIRSQLLGGFNADNLAAAFAVLRTLGLAADEAARRLSALAPIAGRMEAFSLNAALVVVDFAHTPAALEHALQALRPHCSGRLVCVFGCGGERDRGKRPLMGELAERLADALILTDDNPRGEDPDQIIAEIKTGLRRPDRVQVLRDRAEAIRQAVTSAKPGDVVLVAGKGHEEYQLVGGQRHHFSDREQVQALAMAGGAS